MRTATLVGVLLMAAGTALVTEGAAIEEAATPPAYEPASLTCGAAIGPTGAGGLIGNDCAEWTSVFRPDDEPHLGNPRAIGVAGSGPTGAFVTGEAAGSMVVLGYDRSDGELSRMAAHPELDATFDPTGHMAVGPAGSDFYVSGASMGHNEDAVTMAYDTPLELEWTAVFDNTTRIPLEDSPGFKVETSEEQPLGTVVLPSPKLGIGDLVVTYGQMDTFPLNEGSFVVAYDSWTGEEVWNRTFLHERTRDAAVGPDGETIYLGGDHVVALSAVDGRTEWERSFEGVQKVLAGEKGPGVYVLTGSNGVGVFHGLDRSDGTLAWSTEPASAIHVAMGPNEETVAAAWGEVTAWEVETGEQLWKHSNAFTEATARFDWSGELVADPTHSQYLLGARADGEGTVISLAPQTGEVLWETRLREAVDPDQTTVITNLAPDGDDGALYVTGPTEDEAGHGGWLTARLPLEGPSFPVAPLAP